VRHRLLREDSDVGGGENAIFRRTVTVTAVVVDPVVCVVHGGVAVAID
jgi:hypothetical protein